MVRYPVKCRECGHKFETGSADPSCSKCNKKNIEWLEIKRWETITR